MRSKITPTEDVFFLNLDEDISFTAVSCGFEFEMSPLSLYEEASMGMYVMKIAQELIHHPEYNDLIDSLEFPETKETGEIVFRPIDRTKLADLRYILSYLPPSFATLVDNTSFFNKSIKKITKNGQKLAVKNPNNAEKPIIINTFLDFVRYVRGKNVHLQRIIEDLYNQYSEWEKELEIDPVEVKN